MVATDAASTRSNDHRIGTRAGPSSTGAVELARVGQFQVGVEQVEIRRAGRRMGPGDFLGGVVEVGEAPAMGFGEGGHPVRRVGRVTLDVVRRDRHRGHALARNLPGEAAEGVGEVDDEGAVVAGEDDEESAFAGDQGRRRMDRAGSVMERKGWSGGARRELEGGGNFGHAGKRTGKSVPDGLTIDSIATTCPALFPKTKTDTRHGDC